MRRAMSEFEAKRKGYQVTALASAAQWKGNKQEAVAGLKTSATASSHGHDTQPAISVTACCRINGYAAKDGCLTREARL